VSNRTVVITFIAVPVLAALAQAQTFTTLYNFTGGTDGGYPFAGVIQDTAGNLYGTTFYGGDLNCLAPEGCGVVYKLDTAGTETVLHSFSGGQNDGLEPLAPVVRDKDGNLYGTTSQGGLPGYGTVFKIDSAGNETVLYSFWGGSEGCWPAQGLILGKSGAVFGTTSYCGGGIFKVYRTGLFTVLHAFDYEDGTYPMFGHLTMDRSGNLYGVTVEGGGTGCSGSGCGVLYELSKSGTFTVLHRFGGGTSDGCEPYGSVAQDNAGNLYGTTYQCGSNNNGTIWKVSKKGRETILHNFAGGTTDGCDPFGGVTLDADGNLYGDTFACGANGYGVLYELSAKGTLTLLHSFDGSDGRDPYGDEVLRTGKGELFGTTHWGGTYDGGTVWSYVP
jgi:uncharacterized repeat protein (TIGR03803 family)